jgi:deoxyribodipyrimidine photo-lyase
MAKWDVTSVPPARIRLANPAPLRPDRGHVLYWMTATRRLTSNFALARAVEAARTLGRPLVLLEALRCDYPWASDRLHRFVIDGMAAQAAALAHSPVAYIPYVEPAVGRGRGLLAALSADAALVVTDDYPCAFLPAMVARAASRLDVRLEAIDSNGLLPIRATTRTFEAARSFRAHLQRSIQEVLAGWPREVSWADLPRATVRPAITRAWPPTPRADLRRPGALLASLPIDHTVGHAALTGGGPAAHRRLRAFVDEHLDRYADEARHPDLEATSGLSAYLHFGHVSAHEIFEAVMTHEGWTSRRLGRQAGGRREGWWGVGRGAEAFLDQLVTWRELGFNACATQPDTYAAYEAVPAWARRTLARHGRDRRPYLYAKEALASSTTHDALWNAAQRQLVATGWMPGYLRMVWGKKILEWSATPEAALAVMTELMDRFALDGRDPNSYASYAWILGRYDRPWGPERPIYGLVRYMSSEATRRKLKLHAYLATWGGPSAARPVARPRNGATRPAARRPDRPPSPGGPAPSWPQTTRPGAGARRPRR